MSGRVDIFYNGEWGTICRTGRGVHNWDILCQQAGYKKSVGLFSGKIQCKMRE